MKFYSKYPEWWPLFSPPSYYVEEAADLLPRFGPLPPDGTATLLELGSGGGSLVSHFKKHFTLTLTDLSDGMLAQNRALNPEAEFFQGDMRTLRLDRRFDYVFLHDAVCYMTTVADLQAAIATAAHHCRPDGTVLVVPDYLVETFEDGSDYGGIDAPDGRGFRYRWWSFDPDPSDNTYNVDFSFVMRDASGKVRVSRERHTEGLFSKAVWLDAFTRAGLSATCEFDQWDRPIFVARFKPR
jgi:SAM-dependent methyltransferase